MVITPNKAENGFTLVELAIVLMIIGLLIGGILRGQELMENARITATIQQTTAYKGAMITFRDSYNALPGDMVNPWARVPNCNDVPCRNSGDGNGLIDQAITLIGFSTFTGNNTEQRRFWLHLAAAHLITGINMGVTTMNGMGDWGIQYPAAKVNGGFQVGYYAVNYNDPAFPAFSGHFLTLQNSPGPTVLSNFTLTPGKAALFDRKVDDGLPNTGDVLGAPRFDDDSCVNMSTSLYNEASSGIICNLLIKIDN